ncbi:mechanosensitive ion channel family protein [Actinomadura roseirufa]|uniref:mechanosensitive ion channel family protein n=1 Tax=Actinomadura roseirufa TaxID=2094049 RepID=UPI001F5F9AD7|nr:mechanosensitive ion channel domain-containing protein [Actinomadura roseirufa]
MTMPITENVQTWSEKALPIVVTVVVAVVARYLAHRLINKVIDRVSKRGNRAALGAGERRRQRMNALGTVLKIIASAIIVGNAAFSVLGSMGVNLAPILASATVIGAAVGFGAQHVVKDYIAGLFILLEDQYGVGDVIDIGIAKGTVEAVHLRVTTLRTDEGFTMYVRNGEIPHVANESQKLTDTDFA